MRFLKGLSFYIFIIFLSIFQFCRPHKDNLHTKKYPASQLKRDAELFKDVVLAMHPVIGVYKPREYYKTKFEKFVASLSDSLTEKQFRTRLKLLIDDLHCGHTEVIASKEYLKEEYKLKLNYSPYIFLPVGDRVYLASNLNKKQDSTLKKGMEIISINGVKVDSMLRYCRRFISGDGFNQTGKYYYSQMAFNTYYLSLFGRPDTFEVEYKNGKESSKLKYRAIKLKSLPPLPLEPRADSLFVKYKRAKMGYRYLDKDKTVMTLKIEKFSHRKAAKAYRKIFRKLNKNRTKNLVIDLRGNGGGSLANSYRLLSYLIDQPQKQTLRTGIKNYPYKKYTHGNAWFKLTRYVYKIIGEKKTVNDTDNFSYTIKPRKRNHFSGKIYVLINGGSFSASALVASYLKYNNRAVFIGQETGGALEGCNAGITPYYKLPNTKVRIRVPAFRIVHDVEPTITGHGIMPDYEIRYEVKDIFKKQNLELLKAKELLKID